MKLDELRRLAEARAPGKWNEASWQLGQVNFADANFIAAMANHIDALLDAMKDLKWIACIPQDSIIDAPEIWGVVLETARNALAKLEAIK